MRMKRSFALSLCLAALAAAALACNLPNDAPTPAPLPTQTATPEPRGVVKGFGISPRGFPEDYSRFPEFLEEVASLPNSGVMFNAGWREDLFGGTDAGQIPDTAAAIMEQAGVYGYTPIIVFGWRADDNTVLLSVPENDTNNWRNAEAQALFEQMLVDFAERYKPPYLFLGNESDIYWTNRPEDYGRWLEFYNRAYDAVKAVSPETLVGPNFQFERISGQGDFSRWTEPQWGALEAHDLSKVDIVGLTLYPWTGAASPEEIPDNYFAPLVERIGDTPIAITETGWPADPLGLNTAWQASPEAQVRYVAALERTLDGLNVEILNWAFLFPLERGDQTEVFWQSFGALGLYDHDGNRLPVYDVWVEFLPSP